MKVAVVSLTLLALVACHEKSKDKSTPPPTIAKVTGPTTSDLTPGTNGTSTTVEASAPAVGLYLGACKALATNGMASGVEYKGGHVYPITVLYTSPTCTAESLKAWGHTGDYASYALYVARSNSVAGQSAAPAEVTTYDAKAITIKSASGEGVTTLAKLVDVLPAEKRMSIYLANSTADAATGAVKGQLLMNQGPLVDGQWTVNMNCAAADKVFYRQASTVTKGEGGELDFEGRLNEGGSVAVPATTQCQLTLAVQMINGTETSSEDLAWSQVIEVK